MIQVIDPAIREKYFPGLSSLGILRLDLPDPIAGGNKSFKLKYHLEAFRESGKAKLLSFGGAFSNHIAALAHAGNGSAVQTIGIIRGEELNADSNDVLRFAGSRGMQLIFVTREEYNMRYDEKYQQQLSRVYDAYVVPEGGSGEAGIRGCMEILNDETGSYDEIILPSGTGATAEGIMRSAKQHQHVHGIDIVSAVAPHSLGGYAKTNDALRQFIRVMHHELALPLDHVYSGKTLFALHKITGIGSFKGARVLFIHTGGYAFSQG